MEAYESLGARGDRTGRQSDCMQVFLRKKMYKTKICIHDIKGRCNRGGLCAFAHSLEELRDTPNFFKTRLCRDYMTRGRCPNFSTCRFAHGEADLRLSVNTDCVGQSGRGQGLDDCGGAVSECLGPPSAMSSFCSRDSQNLYRAESQPQLPSAECQSSLFRCLSPPPYETAQPRSGSGSGLFQRLAEEARGDARMRSDVSDKMIALASKLVRPSSFEVSAVTVGVPLEHAPRSSKPETPAFGLSQSFMSAAGSTASGGISSPASGGISSPPSLRSSGGALPHSGWPSPLGDRSSRGGPFRSASGSGDISARTAASPWSSLLWKTSPEYGRPGTSSAVELQANCEPFFSSKACDTGSALIADGRLRQTGYGGLLDGTGFGSPLARDAFAASLERARLSARLDLRPQSGLRYEETPAEDSYSLNDASRGTRATPAKYPLRLNDSSVFATQGDQHKEPHRGAAEWREGNVELFESCGFLGSEYPLRWGSSTACPPSEATI